MRSDSANSTFRHCVPPQCRCFFYPGVSSPVSSMTFFWEGPVWGSRFLAPPVADLGRGSQSSRRCRLEALPARCCPIGPVWHDLEALAGSVTQAFPGLETTELRQRFPAVADSPAAVGSRVWWADSSVKLGASC